jgi:transposase
MSKVDVYEIFRRYHSGQTISEISVKEERDRKTIRQYIQKLEESGFTKAKPLPKREELFEAISSILPKADRAKKSYEQLEDLADEFRELIHDKEDGVKPKTAFKILKKKQGLKCSYETFKIFSREKRLKKEKQKTMIRIELPAGEEAQLDYGKVGLHYDAKSGRKRVVNAFCMILSHSRLPFIQFVYSQKQDSFVGSIIDGFEHYDGVPERISIDNLKQGVIKPDLYDPKLNRTLLEMVEYYGVFIDPCRVQRPTDKGKIERMVPVGRELFRELKILNPEASLEELNKKAIEWCLKDYGMRRHGTTGVEPMLVYANMERDKLKRLPDERFELTQWKPVTVHPDQFIQFEKKTYSLPASYCGKELWARKSGNMIHIFQDYKLIREYVIPKGYRAYDTNDFPKVISEMMDGGYPKYLLNQSRNFGDRSYELIKQVLTPHAYLNARRAQGILNIMKEYSSKPYFDYVCAKAVEHRINTPQLFHDMMKRKANELKPAIEKMEISEEGKQMTRGVDYYLN